MFCYYIPFAIVEVTLQTPKKPGPHCFADISLNARHRCILSTGGQYWILFGTTYGASYHQNMMVVRTKNRQEISAKISLTERVLAAPQV